MSLPTLEKAIENQKKLFEAKKPVAPPAPSKLKGEGNMFARPANSTQQNAYGPLGTGDDGRGMAGMPNSPFGRPDDGAAGTVQQGYEPPEHCFIRVVDADIQSGLKYEYRMRVKMKNPNLGLTKTELSNESDGRIHTLYAPWVAVGTADDAGKVTPAVAEVPPEKFYYAGEPAGGKGFPEGQALVQFQRWSDQISVDTYKEPVGDWIVADVPVARGSYVGGTPVLVNVPLWSSAQEKFLFRDVMVKADKPAPKGGRRRLRRTNSSTGS